MKILIIHIIVSYDLNISLISYVKDGSHIRLRHLYCVYITAQRQYIAVQKMRTLGTPWFYQYWEQFYNIVSYIQYSAYFSSNIAPFLVICVFVSSYFLENLISLHLLSFLYFSVRIVNYVWYLPEMLFKN